MPGAHTPSRTQHPCTRQIHEPTYLHVPQPPYVPAVMKVASRGGRGDRWPGLEALPPPRFVEVFSCETRRDLHPRTAGNGSPSVIPHHPRRVSRCSWSSPLAATGHASPNQLRISSCERPSAGCPSPRPARCPRGCTCPNAGTDAPTPRPAMGPRCRTPTSGA